jgi:transcription-repair coupling factor (superfamily II helicase)
LIQAQPQTYKLDGPDKLKFVARFDTPESKVVFVGQLLEQLAA